MNNMNRTIFFLFLILALSACGHQTGDPQKAPGGLSGAVKATVTGSKSFNPNISHGDIKSYKVTVTSGDMETPIEAFFDGSAGSGVVENVPAGRDRIVKVEAINSNEKIIRAGEETGLVIVAGETAEAQIEMESVPVFANLNDGNAIPNTRFIARVFSDPADSVTIEDEFEGVSLPLFDLNLNDDELRPDMSNGEARFSPAPLPAGEHRLTVKNVRTGRSSTVTVRLTDGTKLRPAPLYSGGTAGGVRVGGPLTQGVAYEK